jgi:iron complex transport system ATP-binding protein
MTGKDEAKIDEALQITGIEWLADQPLGELSGGQRQLAWIAMALAQDTKMLLSDEPTTFLDIAHQIEVLEVLETLHRYHGRTIVMVLHDINQAARHAQHMIALVDRKMFASGTPHEMLTSEVLAGVFGIEATVQFDPITRLPFCIPQRRCRQAI